MLRKTLIVVCLLGFVFLASGCRTVQGVGKDIQWIGEKGEEVVN